MQAQTPQFDYLILGAGLSGLLLAKSLVSDSYFSDKRILIIDNSDKTKNDRTWCFWSENTIPWDSIISKKWYLVKFRSASYHKNIPLKNYSYNKVEGIVFYQGTLALLQASGRVIFKTENFK